MSENKESFFKRLYPFFGPSTLCDIELAYILAKHGHRAQFRMDEKNDSGDPLRYFEHVRRVALTLIDEAKIIRSEMIIAAILHDTIEDTKDVRPEMIEHAFGSDVVGIVKILSKDPKDGYLDRFMMCTDWRPYVIKACDRLDNLRSIDVNNVKFLQKQITETQEKYFRLFDRMLDLTPSEHKFGASRLYEEIKRIMRDKTPNLPV